MFACLHTFGNFKVGCSQEKKIKKLLYYAYLHKIMKAKTFLLLCLCVFETFYFLTERKFYVKFLATVDQSINYYAECWAKRFFESSRQSRATTDVKNMKRNFMVACTF